jgi:predicted Rossmann-fold nucleotide-binding protein
MKIAIVGSRRYENKRKIKELIYSLQQKFKKDLTIISGGCKSGADKYTKKFALEADVKYVEYLPAHENKSLFCVLPASYYGKSYSVKNYFARNKQIAKASDIIIGMIPNSIVSNGTQSTLDYGKKFGKKTIIMS